MTILEWILETAWKDVDWIHLAQDKGQRQAAVYTIMRLRVL
jgi:hypothetical protein